MVCLITVCEYFSIHGEAQKTVMTSELYNLLSFWFASDLAQGKLCLVNGRYSCLQVLNHLALCQTTH